jgi:hypothetical protein
MEHENLNTEETACTAKVVDLDEFTRVCGYFNLNTPVNNHYGCDHKDCGEKEIVKVDDNGEHIRFPERIEQKILLACLRKKYGSWQNIVNAYETEDGKKFINEVRNNKMHDADFIALFGCKLQGKCYSFSCPLATECDLQDLQEYDKDLYEEWKNKKCDPSEMGANLMLVREENLL